LSEPGRLQTQLASGKRCVIVGPNRDAPVLTPAPSKITRLDWFRNLRCQFAHITLFMKGNCTKIYKFENHRLAVFGYHYHQMVGNKIQIAWKAHLEQFSLA
jgi:hypothetical protein